MRIIVCIKQVPDHEASQEFFVINAEENKVEPKGIPPVLSLFDENALEAALRIKDADKENVKISVLSLGRQISKATMMLALAAGADEIIKVEDKTFESGYLDNFGIASALAAAIRKIGDYDLILVGRQAADWNAGQTGIGLAAMLDLPVITLAQKVDIDDGKVRVERIIDNGYEVVEAFLPAVVMASNEVGALRYPAMKERRLSKNKPIIGLEMDTIECNIEKENKVILHSLSAPRMSTRECRFITGTTPADAAKNLAQTLWENKVIE